MDAVKQYKPIPEDEDTEKWLADEKLHEGLYQFDNELEKLLDPYWQKIYIKGESVSYVRDLPFTSSGAPELELRPT